MCEISHAAFSYEKIWGRSLMPEYYSLQFVLFMVVTVMVYYYLGKKKPGLQWVCLFAASMLYYLWSGFFYIFFILVTALCTWVSGLLFEKISVTDFLSCHQPDLFCCRGIAKFVVITN